MSIVDASIIKDIIQILQTAEDEGHFRVLRPVEFNKNEVYHKVFKQLSNYDIAVAVMHYVMGGTAKLGDRTPALKKAKLLPILTKLANVGVTLSQLACAFAPMSVIFARTLHQNMIWRTYFKEEKQNSDFRARHIVLIEAGYAWSGAACCIPDNDMFTLYNSWLEAVTRIINNKKDGDGISARVLQSAAISKKQFELLGTSGWTQEERTTMNTSCIAIKFNATSKDVKTLKEVISNK